MSADSNRNTAERERRIAVVGGGISGLAAAHRLIELASGSNLKLRVSLFESGPRLGGTVHTTRIGDCIVELGADSFITNKPWATDLCTRLGLADRLIATDPRYRQALVLRRGKPVPIPDGFLLMAPARVWPVLASRIFSPLGKLRMGMECVVPKRTVEGDESVASFVRRRLGREALERLVQPLVGGIYTSDPEKLSLQATLPRFIETERAQRSLILASRRERRKSRSANSNVQSSESGARYALFASLQDGMSELINALGRRVAADADVRLGTLVSSIEQITKGSDGYRLTLSGTPDAITQPPPFDGVVLAIPTYRAAELTGPIDSLLAAALSEIEYASSAVVVTGHSLADIAHPLNASGLIVPAIEKRQVLSVSFASRKFPARAPAGKVILRSFVGGALQPEMLSYPDDELIAIVSRELGELLGARRKPDFAIVERHEQAMPQYYLGHLDRIRRIERQLTAHPRLAVAGNAYEGIGIPDCIRSGERAAERIFNAL
jgi:oxygen-dependent protoporphyrinogen oxidase